MTICAEAELGKTPPPANATINVRQARVVKHFMVVAPQRKCRAGSPRTIVGKRPPGIQLHACRFAFSSPHAARPRVRLFPFHVLAPDRPLWYDVPMDGWSSLKKVLSRESEP